MLNPTEERIIALLDEGKSHAAIARALGFAPGSMLCVVSRIYRKLGVPNDRSLTYSGKRYYAIRAWRAGAR